MNLMKEETKASLSPIESPEELVYLNIYAPANVGEMLGSAETRGRIRRLSIPHLFFGLKGMDEQQINSLLPHVTEAQWAGILDLDLWARDQMDCGEFLYWQGHICEAEDAVARKLLRATDSELWELTFKAEMKIYAKVEEDEFEQEPEEGELFETPDRNYLILLPANPDKARLLRALILRLYGLDQEYAGILMETTRARTTVEIEEMAYQKRRRRVEDLGFQDYFDAIEVYTFLPPREQLPRKKWEQIMEVSRLPATVPEHWREVLILFQALMLLTRPQESQVVWEELFFVCNKVLSADSVSPHSAKDVKRGIRKAITGINLGLDWWSGGDLQKAGQGIQEHYLESYFQIGYSRLSEVRRKAQDLEDTGDRPEPGSFLEGAIEALLETYPLLAELQQDNKITSRFFTTRKDLNTAGEYLDQISP